MKVVVLHGSPRRGMNSDTLTERFLEGVTEGGEAEVSHFYTNELDVKPCQGCLHCATSPGHACAIDDDMTEIYSAYRGSDLVVWATPMYWGYMTAQLKAVLDRMEALAWEGFYDKTFAVFITYRHHYESTQGFFERIAPYFRINLHVVPCQTYDPETREDLPISSCVGGLAAAYELGRKLSA